MNLQALKTYKINVNGAASHTIIAATAGKKWVVYACGIVAGGAATFEVKSGTTAVTGEIDVTTTPLFFSCSGFPLWTGELTNEALVFTTTGAVDFDGWVLAALIDVAA